MRSAAEGHHLRHGEVEFGVASPGSGRRSERALSRSFSRREVGAVEAGRAPEVGLQRPVDAAQGGGLAAAVRADEPDDLGRRPRRCSAVGRRWARPACLDRQVTQDSDQPDRLCRTDDRGWRIQRMNTGTPISAVITPSGNSSGAKASVRASQVDPDHEAGPGRAGRPRAPGGGWSRRDPYDMGQDEPDEADRAADRRRSSPVTAAVPRRNSPLAGAAPLVQRRGWPPSRPPATHVQRPALPQQHHDATQKPPPSPADNDSQGMPTPGCPAARTAPPAPGRARYRGGRGRPGHSSAPGHPRQRCTPVSTSRSGVSPSGPRAARYTSTVGHRVRRGTRRPTGARTPSPAKIPNTTTAVAPTDAPDEMPSTNGSARSVAHQRLDGDTDDGEPGADDCGEQHPGGAHVPDDLVVGGGPAAIADHAWEQVVGHDPPHVEGCDADRAHADTGRDGEDQDHGHPRQDEPEPPPVLLGSGRGRRRPSGSRWGRRGRHPVGDWPPPTPWASASRTSAQGEGTGPPWRRWPRCGGGC